MVYSHYQPLSQCRMFLEKMGVRTQATHSTAAAAEMIRDDKTAAAIATRRAALLYGLKIVAEDIQDHSNNMTRFVVIDHHDHAPTGKDKTSVVLCLSNDRPGGLYDILREFASENINLTKINENWTTQLNCLTGTVFKKRIELKDRQVQLSDTIIIDRDLNSV